MVEAGGAFVQNTVQEPRHIPKMIWITNASKLGAATMYTAFFAGKAFFPHLVVPCTEVVKRHHRRNAERHSQLPASPALLVNVQVSLVRSEAPNNVTGSPASPLL